MLETLRAGIASYGTPEEVLTDNGSQYITWRGMEKARGQGLNRVSGVVRDIATDGIGEADGAADVVLLFNLLHCEDAGALLRESWRVLRAGGRIGAVHWRSDVPAPRGPELAIRPHPEAIERWLIEAGFTILVPPKVLQPYHFGLVGSKQPEAT